MVCLKPASTRSGIQDAASFFRQQKILICFASIQVIHPMAQQHIISIPWKRSKGASHEHQLQFTKLLL
jgi:hypothetical protein